MNEELIKALEKSIRLNESMLVFLDSKKTEIAALKTIEELKAVIITAQTKK